MAFCPKCGASVKEGAAYCANCGAKQPGADGRDPEYNSSSDQSKTYAVLAVVLPILFFLPLVTEPKTEFGTFWANQALLLLISFAISSALSFFFLGYILGTLAIVLWIFGIIRVCRNEMKPIPLIGEIKIIQ